MKKQERKRWYEIFFQTSNIQIGEKLKLRLPSGILLIIIILSLIGLVVYSRMPAKKQIRVNALSGGLK